MLSEGFLAPGAFVAGSLVAGYQLEDQLGAGGMAIVYRARDQRLGRLVALKILAPALAADEGFRRRFIAESRAAAAVDDPHIIPVYDAGEANGALFIAMRFVAGGDLRRVLTQEGPLPPGRAAQFLSPVASALDAAHRVGLVHRDVKPANILVDTQPDRPDHVYLSDFGVSKAAAASVSLTGTGQFLGTPEYSAPEQVRGLPVDGRADQYALACVAWRLLTDSAPFERDQGLAMLLAHVSDPPPSLAERRPDLPAAAGRVLARALAKAPEDRYRSCREFAETLRNALGLVAYTSAGVAVAGRSRTEISVRPGFTSPAANGPAANGSDAEPDPRGTSAGRPPGSTNLLTAGRPARPGDDRTDAPARHGWRRPLVIAVVCAVIATAVAVPLILAEHGPPATGSRGHTGTAGTGAKTRTSPLAGPLTGTRTATLTYQASGGVGAVAFGPGGILAVADANGRTYLWNTATRSITATLADPASSGVELVAFGPHGSVATADANGSTYLWDAAAGTITATLTDPAGKAAQGVAFGPGGAVAVADANGRTYLWNTATGTITATLADPGSKGVEYVAFGPDGTVATADANGSSYVWDTATRKITATLTDPAVSKGVDQLAFGPATTTLATADANGITYLWDTATRKITATLTDPAASGVEAVAFGPAGATLATGFYHDGQGIADLWRIARRTH